MLFTDLKLHTENKFHEPSVPEDRWASDKNDKIDLFFEDAKAQFLKRQNGLIQAQKLYQTAGKELVVAVAGINKYLLGLLATGFNRYPRFSLRPVF